MEEFDSLWPCMLSLTVTVEYLYAFQVVQFCFIYSSRPLITAKKNVSYAAQSQAFCCNHLLLRKSV